MRDESTLVLVMTLDALDETTARFVHRHPLDGTSQGTITVARSLWEERGRPDPMEVGVHARPVDR